ncbi:MAG: FxSxx-COOH system tetratricopeptide repeat protein [Methanothrix sp.]
MKDFFISYNNADSRWAEWIASQLEEAGYSTIIQCWDFLPGCNFVLEMHEAAKEAKRTIGVLSPNFLASMFTQPEWSAAFVKDPSGESRKLLLIRVQDCLPDGLLAAINYLDLVGLDEDTARDKILAVAGGKRLKPDSPPGFPGTHVAKLGPRFPGALPPIWNIPTLRNPNFTGREKMLSDLHDALNSGLPGAGIQALTGLDGKGKTSMAREFAYRYHQDYDLIWWVRADEPATLSPDYAVLAKALDLSQKDSPDQVVNAVKSWLGQNQKWLLIFDNAQEPDVLKRFLPQGGGGHIIITSRNPIWGSMARVLPVEVFELVEAVDFIFKRTNQHDEVTSKLLAEETGRLPLALEQASAYVEETGISLSDYLIRFRNHKKDALEHGNPADYPDTVATAWNLSFKAVMEKSPACADLINLCSFLAPDNIPKSLITAGSKDLPEPLASATADEFEFDRVIADLRRYSLISGIGESFSVHQLVQVVTRYSLTEEEQKKWSSVSAQIINNAFQFDVNSMIGWEKCAPLLLHVLASAGYAEELGVALVIIADVLNKAGGCYQRYFADFDEAKSCFERALELAEKAFALDHPSVAMMVNNLGGVLQELGDMDEAKGCFEWALDIDEKAFGPDHPCVAMIVNNLGGVLRDVGEWEEAKTCFGRALDIDEKAFGPDHPSVAIDVNNLGLVLRDMGVWEEAKDCFERALGIDEKAFGPEHPSVATNVNNLGLVLQDLGEWEEAKDCFERALEIDEKAFGPDHPSVARDVNNLGLVLRDMGEWEKEKNCFERALDIDEKAFGPNHPSVARDVNNLGGVLLDLGEWEMAKTCFERALDIDEKAFGPEHPSVAIDVNNLGSALQDLKEWGKAKTCFEWALKIDEKALGPEHSSVAIDVNNLGEVLLDLGEREKAKDCFERSIRIFQKILGDGHPTTKKVKANLDVLNSQNP